MDIGNRLREERERLGMTQEVFGALGGVLKRALIRYESGERYPDAAFLRGVSAVGVDVLYVLTGQRTPKVPSLDALPEDERVLLSGYRLCNAQAKHHLLQSATLLAAGLPSAPSTSHSGMNMSDVGDGNVQIGSIGGSYSAIPPKPSPRSKPKKTK